MQHERGRHPGVTGGRRERRGEGSVAGGGGSLASTGVEVGGVAAAGTGLLVAGGLLVQTSQRRTA